MAAITPAKRKSTSTESTSMSMSGHTFNKCHDLTQLEEITLENVLECLVERYASSLYYTFAGQMLISMNPCLHGPRKSIGDVNELKRFEKDSTPVPGRVQESNGSTSTRSSGTTTTGTTTNPNRSPHIFWVGEQCMKSLLSVGNNQIIIVSGDSGAGKTTAIQQLLQYFIRKNESLRHLHTPNGLDKKICFATSILESMGNASTTANTNSSRFGRFVQLNYEPTYGSIIGASIRTCLLEKHRVSKCSPNERNFHIFYYVLYGLDKGIFHLTDFVEPLPESEIDLDLENVQWKELVPPHLCDAIKSDDGGEFLALHRSLQSLNLAQEMNRVFRVVFGLIVLLNVEFIPEPDDDDEDDVLSPPPVGITTEFTVHPRSSLNLEIAGLIFGLEPEELLETFVARKIVAGGGGARARRKSVFRKPCESIGECNERRSAIVSSVYDTVFNHVLGKVNSMLKVNAVAFEDDFDGTGGLRDELLTISLLDLYGFENLELNHLEQLCINYANERLHKVYLEQLRTARDEFSSSNREDLSTHSELNRISVESVERLDYLQSVLFSTLNEECLLNRPTGPKADADLYERLSSKISSKAKGSKYAVYRRVYDASCPFIVRHYASDVEYRLQGMVRKNADYVPPEFGDLLGSSQSMCIKTMITPPPISNGTGNGAATPASTSKAGREKTVLQRFKSDVDGLISALRNEDDGPDSQDLHFIKCIRPSDDLMTTFRLSRTVVQRQLYSAGIVDAIKVAGNGLPVRVVKQKFLRTFHGLLRRYKIISMDGLEQLTNILPDVVPSAEVKLTNTHVCLSEALWNHFKTLNTLVRRHSAERIAKAWLARLERKREQERVAALACALAAAKSRAVAVHFSQAQAIEIEANEAEAERSRGTTPIRPNSGTCLRKPFLDVVRDLRPILNQLNLGVDSNLVTRGQVYRGPKHFFIEKPMLPFAHIVPRCLRSQGLAELLK